MDKPSHLNDKGQAHIVDISNKSITKRVAVCKGKISMSNTAFMALENVTADKGDVLAAARIAGIMGAKRCYESIPLCHLVSLESINIDFILNEKEKSVEAICNVSATGKTGVEMEGMTGVSIALLTIYDMLKSLDRGMIIGDICLYEKRGGKSGSYKKEPQRN